MIRTAIIAWISASVPCSILLGRMCREASLPVPGWGSEPARRTAVVAPERAAARR